jgi:hypothetical protein
VIIYGAVPYLVVAAPAIIVLLTILIGGCTMTRTVGSNEPVDPVRYYSEPRSRTDNELIHELDRRAAREELRRVVEEGQR